MMNRREFIKTGLIAVASLFMPKIELIVPVENKLALSNYISSVYEHALAMARGGPSSWTVIVHPDTYSELDKIFEFDKRDDLSIREVVI